MSETDSFIDEVTEEVRRDKLFALFRKYGWIGILVVLLIVGGAAWNEWQKARAEAEARAFGDAVLAALDSDDPAARVAALDGLAPEGAGAHAVAGMLAAEEALNAGDREAAAARLAGIAEDGELSPSLRDLARLKAVILAGPTMTPEARDAALADLARPGAPYRALAMEQQALAEAEAGRTEEALAILDQILQEPDATAGLRRRVTELIVVLGGEPGAA
ncbi:hypothetical protein DEA8626_01095 [Defluviimonas aquaemixtae]|uniref:Ancillary SecYEG translocon subunit/Cell division coordinator CpoB TPR domain-containing protein n=1 Tax=Albidovulum aquaemixtae TaxID=1542388 RepID=A0A2R8B4U8_9RHOB|nr:tetratricopeptide repeat protein [Defluviimonas aquaemixtae]SPH17572.1 hypothetical protein DEA8626_01095 [Defluviimonas aquaemixtae]